MVRTFDARVGALVVSLVSPSMACGGPVAAVPDEKAPAGKAPAEAKRKVEPPAKAPPEVAPARALPKTLALGDAEAKAAELHAAHRQSFFCGCSYTPQMRTIRQSCGYKTRADDSLAHDIVWTRVVPPDAFGAHRTCWTTESCRRDDGTSFGGIECCRKQDPVFAAMEADLFNIVPAIAEVAKDRSDFPFGEIKGEERMYGACDIEVDGAKRVAEPPERVRGDIARVYLYMRAAYGDELKVPADQWTRFETWQAEDPPDDWERQRAAAIMAIQGVRHPLLDAPAAAPPEGKAPEGKAPDAKAPDAKAPDAKAPAGKAPDAKKAPKTKTG
ncbi:MAG: endonuclease [Myxococcales bacterium]|nr:endonuclease [Myxococcales bacterium]